MQENNFEYFSEQFADVRILRYRVPGFDELPLKRKVLLYYLYEAALCGRDMIWDQNYKYNLAIRDALENIYKTFSGDQQDEKYSAFADFMKRVWFSNGIHHHYSMDKLKPAFPEEYLQQLVEKSDAKGFDSRFQSVETVTHFLQQQLFDDSVASKRVVLDEGKDIIAASANNFYEGVTQKEAEDYYALLQQPFSSEPISLGLNSKLVKENGEIKELVWSTQGMYGEALKKVVFWLEKAMTVAESEHQRKAFEKLIQYFETGELRKFDEYNIEWLKDTDSVVDVINGFIEVYGDPLGRKATFESVVSVEDQEATHRVKTVSENAEWFEKHSTTDEDYKKDEIKGVNGRAVNVVMESGDCSPSTPIGINLPNADWMRAAYGSKSVTLSNIVHAYDMVSKTSGSLDEFAWSDEEKERARTHGAKSSSLHVDLHEIVGHGSGKQKEGVDPGDTLKMYASTIEEARADLVALYFAIDPKLIELGLMETLEEGKAEYDGFIRSALLVQLVRVEKGKNIEEAHMRNRYLIANWVLRKGAHQKVIERKEKEGKTYFTIPDYTLFRTYIGILLKEVQRIKSEGDFAAARSLVEEYGVKVDQAIHEEVLSRWEKLKIAPYAGFINPILHPEKEGDQIKDIKIEYPNDFAAQMLGYSKAYAFLPVRLDV